MKRLTPRAFRRAIVGVVALVLVALGCFFTAMGSALLRMPECNNSYSITAANPDCRGPMLLSVAWMVALGGAACTLVVALWRRPRVEKTSD